MDDLEKKAPVCNLAIGKVVRYHRDRENATQGKLDGMFFDRLTENRSF